MADVSEEVQGAEINKPANINGILDDNTSKHIEKDPLPIDKSMDGGRSRVKNKKKSISFIIIFEQLFQLGQFQVFVGQLVVF